MKWEKYNMLTKEQKEEYDFRFRNKDYDSIYLASLIILVIGLIIYKDFKDLTAIFFGSGLMIFYNILVWISFFKEYKFLKKCGVN